MSMVKRFSVKNEMGEEIPCVLASDYDALAAELAELKPRERLLYDGFSKSRDRIRELEAALQTVLHETLTSDEWDSLERKWCATLDRKGEPK